MVRVGYTSHSPAHFDVLLAPGRFMPLSHLMRGRIGQSLLRLKFGIDRTEMIAWWDKAEVIIEDVRDKDFEFREADDRVSVNHLMSAQSFTITREAFQELRKMLGKSTPLRIEESSWFEEESNEWGFGAYWQSFRHLLCLGV